MIRVTVERRYRCQVHARRALNVHSVMHRVAGETRHNLSFSIERNVLLRGFDLLMKFNQGLYLGILPEKRPVHI